jgi:hypothetical protein
MRNSRLKPAATTIALLSERLGTERPRFPDLTLGRSTLKRTAVEEYGSGAGEIIVKLKFVFINLRYHLDNGRTHIAKKD